MPNLNQVESLPVPPDAGTPTVLRIPTELEQRDGTTTLLTGTQNRPRADRVGQQDRTASPGDGARGRHRCRPCGPARPASGANSSSRWPWTPSATRRTLLASSRHSTNTRSPSTSFIRHARAVIKKHRRTFIIFNVAFYGLFVASMITTAFFPQIQGPAVDGVQGDLNQPLTTTLPSLVIPFFGVAFSDVVPP